MRLALPKDLYERLRVAAFEDLDKDSRVCDRSSSYWLLPAVLDI
jgi:hypothetical protein